MSAQARDKRATSRLGLLAGATLVALLLQAAPSSAASVTITGTVRCPSGAKVVGVWVQSSGGGSKFASRWGQPGASHVSAYEAKSVGTGKVALHVGCGGKESRWDSDQYTSGVTVSKSRAINAICTGKKGTFKKITCNPARPNKGKGSNTFYAGNCTWFAAKKWKEASGGYPSWSGNAWLWDNHAKEHRWTVLGTPAPRSVVVFERGVQGADDEAGHVAWVNSVSRRSDGWYLNISEMNFAVKGGTSSRPSVKHVSGMSYIWPPNSPN